MLTNLNALTTIGYLGPENLLLIVLDNQQYASTGGQATFTTRLDLGAIAASCGLRTWKADDLETLKESIAEAAKAPGPGFIHMKIAPGNSHVPLLLDDPVILGDRFTRWLSSASGR
jgi:thiamine pyrophosphate-dependent acetolactate synthase large subunit-like protein